MDRLENYCLNITDGEHGSVIDDNNGKYYLLSNKNMINGEVVITPEDRKISEESFFKINKRTKLSKDDVLISTVGTIGKVALVEGNVNYDFQRSVGILKCNTEVLLPKFLYYYLNSPYIQNKLINTAKGAIQKCIFINDLKNLEVSIPSIPLQKKISEVLAFIDSKIKLNNKINTELENMAKTLYDYWFVQFDFPDENKRPYKSANGKMVYNEVLKREIPLGWKIGTLRDICKIIRGVSYDKKVVSDVYLKGFTPIFRANNIDNGHINYDSLVYVPNDLISSSQNIRKNDVIMTMSSGSLNHLGKTYKSKTNMNYSYGAFCSKISPITNYRHYLSSFLSSLSFQIYIKNMCLGTNINNLNNDHIYSAPICIPSSSLLDRFNGITDTIFSMIGKNEQENVELVSVRDFLLPLLMNGQVSVQN